LPIVSYVTGQASSITATSIAIIEAVLAKFAYNVAEITNRTGLLTQIITRKEVSNTTSKASGR
jgi:hypothetical protein